MAASYGGEGRRDRAQVYRASPNVMVLAWIADAACFLVGVVTVAGSPANPGKGGMAGVVLGIVSGALWILLSLLLVAVLATNRLIVTSAGLICRNYLRRKLVGWAEVASFTVGPDRSHNGWPTLIVDLDDGSRVFTSVVAFTASYPARVARELATLQAGAGPVLDEGTVAGSGF